MDELDKLLIAVGGRVKAIGNGELSGYGISFGNETRRDLYGQYFTKSGIGDANTTYYGAHKLDGVDTFVHHGFVLSTGQESKEELDILKRYARTRLNPVKTVEDEVGLASRVIMNMNEEYQAMLYEMASKGILSFSSGALHHIYEVEDNGHVKTWIGGEMSLTPTPAEWRSTNLVLPMKSFLKETGATLVDADSYRQTFPTAVANKSVSEQPVKQAIETLEEQTVEPSTEQQTAKTLKEQTPEPVAVASLTPNFSLVKTQMAIKSALLGDSIEARMTMAAIWTLTERLYDAIWYIIYGPQYDGISTEPVDVRLELLGAYVDEFKTLLLGYSAAGMNLVESDQTATRTYMTCVRAAFAAIRAGKVLSAQNETDLSAAVDLNNQASALVAGVIAQNTSKSIVDEIAAIRSMLAEHREQYEADQRGIVKALAIRSESGSATTESTEQPQKINNLKKLLMGVPAMDPADTLATASAKVRASESSNKANPGMTKSLFNKVLTPKS